MLISGGKVLAIDKVLHDQTLTGDGRFVKLGVNSGYFITQEYADSHYQEKGDYVETSALSRYYTKYQTDQKFATIAGTYSRDEADDTFQPKGDYATTTELAAQKAWVESTYWTSAYIKEKYASIEYVDGKIDGVNRYITNQIEPRLDSFEEHARDTDIHLSVDDRNFLEVLSGYDFTKFVSVTSVEHPDVDATYGIKYDGASIYLEPITGGGGGGGYPIEPQAGLSGEFIDGTLHLGFTDYNDLLDFTATISGKVDYWDAKQDALTQEQLDAIDSITDTYDVVGDGTCIAVASDPATRTTTISYIGRQGNVELVESEAAATDPDLIYLVIGEK